MSLARETDCVVLLKGATTLIADRDGRVRVVRSGTPTLATAGSGDVLSGVIGATIARGHDPLDAAALGAHLTVAPAPRCRSTRVPRISRWRSSEIIASLE